MTELSNRLNAMMEAYPKNFRMGTVHGRGILLRRPSFDCDWYWGFGYLGNVNTHYHLNGLATMDWQNRDMQNKHLHDQLKLHFGDSLTITDEKDLWQFCEIVKTIYTLREAADLFHIGGSHYAPNPNRELLKDTHMWLRINSVLIPEQIASLYALLEKYRQ